MNYNSLINKPTINNKELIGNNKASDIGGLSEEEMEQLLTTDLSSYYTKAQIDDLFSRSFVYREKSGSIVTFDCPESTTSGITKVVSNIVAVQSGTGDPSPTNIRPITGWSAVNVAVSPTTDAEDGTTYTTQLKDGQGNPMTCYGGTLDVVNGVLTVDRVSLTVDENSNIISGSGGLPFRIDLLTGAKASSSASALTGVKCNLLKEVTQSSHWGVDGTFSRVTTDAKIVYFKVNSEITTIQQLKTFLQSNNLQFVYELATPITIQLTPTAVKSLLGTNNLWADSGDITVKALDKIIQG